MNVWGKSIINLGCSIHKGKNVVVVVVVVVVTKRRGRKVLIILEKTSSRSRRETPLDVVPTNNKLMLGLKPTTLLCLVDEQ
jgi:hypothetical protein